MELSYMLMDLGLPGESTTYIAALIPLINRYQCSLGVAEEVANIAQEYLDRQRE
jgi:hypothetical protein